MDKGTIYYRDQNILVEINITRINYCTMCGQYSQQPSIELKTPCIPIRLYLLATPVAP